jgi:hypothetical protein
MSKPPRLEDGTDRDASALHGNPRVVSMLRAMPSGCGIARCGGVLEMIWP